MSGAILKENLALINANLTAPSGLTAKDASASFAIGEALFKIYMNRDQGVFWKDYVADCLPFSLATANAHMRLYEAYKDRPEILEGMSAAEARRRAREARRE
jgi:hypothetical protein